MKKGLAGLFEFFDLRIKDRFCAEVRAKPDGYDARGGTCPDFLSGAIARAQDEELGFECFGAVHGDGGEPGERTYLEGELPPVSGLGQLCGDVEGGIGIARFHLDGSFALPWPKVKSGEKFV
jgi:hypothetical protein